MCVVHLAVTKTRQTPTAHLLVPILGSSNQRRRTVCRCLYIWVSFCLEQFAGDMLVTILGGDHQRCEGIFVHLLEIRPRLEQFAGDLIEMV